MTYEQWKLSVPSEFTCDPLWKMEVYSQALFAADLAWPDATKLLADKRTIGLSDQLYRATGAVSSDIAEGYSRQSGKDQARYYEYALGSAREARNWYYEGRHVLGEKVAAHRIQLLTHVIRQLLKIIPAERGYHLREEAPEYGLDISEILTNIPGFPNAEKTEHAIRNTSLDFDPKLG